MLPKPLRISPSAGKIDIIVPARKLSRGKGRRIICIGCGVVGDCGAHKSLHSITRRVRGSHVYRATPGQVLEIVPIEKRGPRNNG